MKLLSRNAEELFWLARYLERASSLARVIEMQGSFGAQNQEAGWTSLLALYNDEERYLKDHEPTAAGIISYYVLDRANPGSIRACIHMARENARALRAYIPREMWAHLNDFNGQMEALTSDDIVPANLPRTCARMSSGCLAQAGIADGTLFRDEGWLFYKLGRLVERADQTSRLLDVKFAQARAGALQHDPSTEFVFWSTILRTAAAYQVFQRLEQERVEPERVARFLILNSGHPRSVAFCVHEIADALHHLRGTFHLPRSNAALEACEVLNEGLLAASRDKTLATHLHAFNDWIQSSLITLTGAIDTAFFSNGPVEAAGGTSMSQKQSQG
jgi:uncharacterized alpha-E superfamily protein